MSTEATAKAIERQAQEFAEAWGVPYVNAVDPPELDDDDTSATLARRVLCELAGRDVCAGLDDTYNVEIEADVFVQLPNYLLPSAFATDAPRPWDRLGKLAEQPPLAPVEPVPVEVDADPPTPEALADAEQSLAASSPPAKSTKRRKRA